MDGEARAADGDAETASLASGARGQATAEGCWRAGEEEEEQPPRRKPHGEVEVEHLHAHACTPDARANAHRAAGGNGSPAADASGAAEAQDSAAAPGRPHDTRQRAAAHGQPSAPAEKVCDLVVDMDAAAAAVSAALTGILGAPPHKGATTDGSAAAGTLRHGLALPPPPPPPPPRRTQSHHSGPSYDPAIGGVAGLPVGVFYQPPPHHHPQLWPPPPPFSYVRTHSMPHSQAPRITASTLRYSASHRLSATSTVLPGGSPDEGLPGSLAPPLPHPSDAYSPVARNWRASSGTGPGAMADGSPPYTYAPYGASPYGQPPPHGAYHAAPGRMSSLLRSTQLDRGGGHTHAVPGLHPVQAMVAMHQQQQQLQQHQHALAAQPGMPPGALYGGVQPGGVGGALSGVGGRAMQAAGTGGVGSMETLVQHVLALQAGLAQSHGVQQQPRHAQGPGVQQLPTHQQLTMAAAAAATNQQQQQQQQLAAAVALATWQQEQQQQQQQQQQQLLAAAAAAGDSHRRSSSPSRSSSHRASFADGCNSSPSLAGAQRGLSASGAHPQAPVTACAPALDALSAMACVHADGGAAEALCAPPLGAHPAARQALAGDPAALLRHYQAALAAAAADAHHGRGAASGPQLQCELGVLLALGGTLSDVIADGVGGGPADGAAVTPALEALLSAAHQHSADWAGAPSEPLKLALAVLASAVTLADRPDGGGSGGGGAAAAAPPGRRERLALVRRAMHALAAGDEVFAAALQAALPLAGAAAPLGSDGGASGSGGGGAVSVEEGLAAAAAAWEADQLAQRLVASLCCAARAAGGGGGGGGFPGRLTPPWPATPATADADRVGARAPAVRGPSGRPPPLATHHLPPDLHSLAAAGEEEMKLFNRSLSAPHGGAHAHNPLALTQLFSSFNLQRGPDASAAPTPAATRPAPPADFTHNAFAFAQLFHEDPELLGAAAAAAAAVTGLGAAAAGGGGGGGGVHEAVNPSSESSATSVLASLLESLRSSSMDRSGSVISSDLGSYAAAVLATPRASPGDSLPARGDAAAAAAGASERGGSMGYLGGPGDARMHGLLHSHA